MKKVIMSLVNQDQVRWAFNLTNWNPTLIDLTKATACIQQEEKERLAKFVFQDDFKASLIGRLLMRKFVHEVTSIPYECIKFGRDLKGKPYITDNDTNLMDFNVSHQGSYAVLAGVVKNNQTNNDMKVGVDVMKIEYSGGKSLDEFFRIMTRNFSPDEWRSIKKSACDTSKLREFMRHWCLKESYVKNIGVGITIDLQKINFITKESLDMNKIITSTCLDVDGVKQTNWRFEESFLDDEHIVAVALKNPEESTSLQKFQTLTFDQLMEHSKPLLPYDETYCQQILAKEHKKKS